MTISINTIAGNDVITLSEAQSGITLSGSKSNEVFDTVELRIFNSGGTQVYSAEFDGGATAWSHSWSPSGSDGTYTLSVDLPYDSGGAPATRTFVLDRTRPALSSITISDTELFPGETALVTFQFSEAVAGFTAQDVVAGFGSISNFTAVDGDTYTAIFTPGVNTEGWSTIRVSTGGPGDVRWTDMAGNQPVNWPSGLTDSEMYLVDTRPPTPGVLSLSAFTDTGSIETPAVTSDTLFRLQSTAPTDQDDFTRTDFQGAFNGGAFHGTSGEQRFLADGTYRYRAIYTDDADNISFSNVIEVIIDTVAPVAGTLAFANLTDSGSDDAPDITTDNAFDLTLSGQGASTIVTYEVSNDDGATWSATTASQSGLADGTYRFRAAVADAAGNRAESYALTVTVDQVAVPGTLAFANLVDTGSDDASDITTDNAFTLALTGREASAVSTYEVSTDGGATWTTTTANQAGLADATYQFRTRVTDGAGNSAIGNVIQMTVDHRAPTGTLAFANLSGVSGGITADNTFDLVLSGQEAGAGVSYQVSTDGGGAWLTTGASQSGLAEGAYRFRAFMVDAAGNISGTNALAITIALSAPPNTAPVNTVPGALEVEANHSLAIELSVSDADADPLTTTLAVAHGVLAAGPAGGAEVTGNGTGTLTIAGTLAEINATLAAGNVTYTPAHDFFGTDALTVATSDGGLTDTDVVSIHVDTLLTGTADDDSYAAPSGNARIDGFGGHDAVAFGFRLADATVSYRGNTVIIDGPNGSHTVLAGVETYVFADGTVENGDGSPLIDDLFYYSRYHDAWNAQLDAELHYAVAGRSEGRDPNAFFNTSLYRSVYPDVAGIDPLVHFDAVGWKHGRAPSLDFDGAKYLAANPDVAAAQIDPLWHFLATGASEGRQPFAVSRLLAADGFDYAHYLNTYADVKAAGVDPLQHFRTVGWQEGRNPNALFDTSGYLATYTDVAAAHINPLDHYNLAGWKEGRDPSVGFDTSAYLAAYTDVAAANINPLVHFLHAGQNEGRSAFADGVWG